uniref:Uncharacterized protein n=1 Tax=Parascaris univalens TaxID=6257 RepID=A0A914ZWP3_PARUN
MSTRINFNDIKGIERASSFRLYYIPRKSKTRKRYASVRGDKEVGSSMSTRINFNDIKGIERGFFFSIILYPEKIQNAQTICEC